MRKVVNKDPMALCRSFFIIGTYNIMYTGIVSGDTRRRSLPLKLLNYNIM